MGRRNERALRIPELRARRHPDGGPERHATGGSRTTSRAAATTRCSKILAEKIPPEQVDRRGQEVGAARPRRRGLSDGPQVELHAEELRRRQVRRLQFRRRRARHVQGPRHPALQPARGVRGHGHRRVRDGRQPRLQLHPRRDLGRLPALRGGDRGGVRGGPARRQHPRARTSRSTCTTITASARTSAARRRRCSSRSKARRGSRGSSRRSPRPTACTASRRRSTTPRRLPRCRGSSTTAAKRSSNLGRPNNGGTKIFSVSGDVERPGNYEVKLGTPFATLLEMAGGMRGGRKLKACIPGGSSMPVLPGDVMMATDMDYDSIAKAGSMLGSGAVIIMDETRCMVSSLLRLSYFYYEESCGQCTPCREGTGWLWRMVDRIERGQGRNEDLDMLNSVADNIAGPHDLRAGRRSGAAGEELHQAFPRRIPVPHRPQALPGRRRMPDAPSMLNIEIDGKTLQVAHGSIGDRGRALARHLRAAFLLSQEAVDRRQLPHVPRAGREGAEAACPPARRRSPKA